MSQLVLLRHGQSTWNRDNLFTGSIVAVNADTGKMVWYFQSSPHDTHDWDSTQPAVLIDDEANGQKRRLIAQAARNGHYFLLDRTTGTPLFPVEERPVPPSDVPGEWSWPTQPLPVKPAPLARMAITGDELSRVTPEA